METNAWTIGSIATLAVASLAISGCGGAENNGEADGDSGGGEDLIWATSSQGSDVYSASVEMAELMSRQGAGNVTVQSVGGSEASLLALAEGNADLTLVNSLALIEAFEGQGQFEEPMDVRLHMQGFLSERQLIVRADSGINSPADLEGRRCACVRPALSELEMMTTAVLETWDVDPDSVDLVSTNETNEAITALRQGNVDAVMLPGSIGAAPFLELAQSTDVEWINLAERQDELLSILGPAFSSSTIPAGTYEGQDDDVDTLALRQVTAVRADMSEESASALAEAVWENYDSMSDPNAQDWSVETAVSNTIPIPYHEGVVSYLDDLGEWSEELERAQDEAPAE